MQVEPQQVIPLVYNITDPFDSATYYVRAVVSDSLTRAVISTVDLADRGSGRYDGVVNAPADMTGFGRHIDVVITVYTDSGYTSISPDKERIIDKYLVRRVAQSFGGQGVDIDYVKIKKFVTDAVSDELKKLDIPQVDLQPVVTSIKRISKSIEDIRIPETKDVKPTDLTPVIREIQALGDVIKKETANISIPVPIDHTGDFNGIGDKVDSITQELRETIVTKIDSVKKEISSLLPGIVKDELAKSMKSFAENNGGTVIIETEPEKDDTEKKGKIPSPFDTYFKSKK